MRHVVSVEWGRYFAHRHRIDGGVDCGIPVRSTSLVEADGVSALSAGMETRNVLIVGAGRVGHALRNHIDSLQHLGFRFKGFVALTEREAETGDADVIGDVRNCLSLARSLFVDEIFFSVPGDKKMVISMVEEARIAGIDVRVVPDMYDGLAWNAKIEYIGQFPTIPLHRKDFPIGSFLLKRTLDITVSSLALLVAAPVMMAIAIAVRMDSEGSIFYKGAEDRA